MSSEMQASKPSPRPVNPENAKHMPLMYKLAAQVALDMGLTVPREESQ